ncbi:ATP-dependent helicase HrpB [Echinimonas agarilytica]|uniref:ATP-dependent helicase HrpB n=1 Tax=Echinimonas agarilytica TaxID=1215918 RepID=A0AA41W4Q2_9GAMM|nr:ATP-dependent helicase HrpB [Echinimonas agarilytica]
MTLPVQTIADQTIEHLASGQDVILTAPTGSGKSTLLPLLLLASPHFEGKSILMLEPRRLAAMSVARYMASQIGEAVGQQVGYRIRQDQKSSANTRLLVVTEGILTRILQHDPELAEFDVVIFDECHERNLHADLAFALCLDAQQGLREDLRLMMMSATLAVDDFQRCLPEAQRVTCEGRQFPVHCHYQLRDTRTQWLPQCLNLLNRAITEQSEGDILVFLPGVSEIKRLHEQFRNNSETATQFELLELYGDMPQKLQQKIFEHSEQRRIIFSTNIAETSLTLPRVRVVVDSGFERSMRFVASAATGRLELRQIALASAQQRAGRAGRVAEGHCYRLWSEQQQLSFQPTIVPEVEYSDLTQLALELANWGVSELTALRWITMPNVGHWRQAQAQLKWMNAIDNKGTLTTHGQLMHRSGSHPRWAHLMVNAAKISDNSLALACLAAALLDSKDVLQGRHVGVEFSQRIEQVLHSKGSIHNAILQQARQWYKRNSTSLWPSNIDSSELITVMMQSFPDRVAKLRQNQQYAMANGSGVQLPMDDGLTQSSWLLVLHYQLSEHHSDGWVRYAIKLSEQDVNHHLSDHIQSTDHVYWDEQKKKVVGETQRRFGSIVLSKQPLPSPDGQQLAYALMKYIERKGLKLLPWTDAARSLCERSRLVQQLQLHAHWPDFSETALVNELSQWLLPYLQGMRTVNELKSLNLTQILKSYLGYQHEQQLAQWFPTHFDTPLGRSVHIEYAESGAKISVPMQEMYGFDEIVELAGGHYRLTFELLSPAKRPIQLTQNLPQFWAGSYRDVQKEMKGRYPKHVWPDDPANTQPTRYTKRRPKT